jgi:hypothetical protein
LDRELTVSVQFTRKLLPQLLTLVLPSHCLTLESLQFQLDLHRRSSIANLLLDVTCGCVPRLVCGMHELDLALLQLLLQLRVLVFEELHASRELLDRGAVPGLIHAL